MAPLRRYLRITQYSVLECRIYLDNPALAESWLLNSRDPVLPRVMESVRPFVLPKLREENERRKGKGGNKKKGVKDVVVESDYEVSIFLTETSSRHSLLTKQKHFNDPNKQRMKSNSSKLTGDTSETAIDIDDTLLIRTEDSDADEMNIQDLPEALEHLSDTDGPFVSEDDGPQRSKRARGATIIDSDGEFTPDEARPSKRSKDKVSVTEEEADNKKKMAMHTTYDGFSIYGRVLCLVIKRKDKKGKNPAVIGGQAMMEDWIASTQVQPEH